MPASRASSRPRDGTRVSYVSCFGRQVLYHQCHLEDLIRHVFFLFPWDRPPCPFTPGGHPAAEGAFNWQVYFSAALCSELNKEEEKDGFGYHICNVRGQLVTPCLALFVSLPVPPQPRCPWALQTWPVPSPTRPAVPLFLRPPSAGLCLKGHRQLKLRVPALAHCRSSPSRWSVPVDYSSVALLCLGAPPLTGSSYGPCATLSCPLLLLTPCSVLPVPPLKCSLYGNLSFYLHGTSPDRTPPPPS